MSWVVVLDTPLIGPRDSLARRIRLPLSASGNRVKWFRKSGRSLLDDEMFMIATVMKLDGNV